MMYDPTIAAPLAAHLFLLQLLLAAWSAARASCNLVLTLVNALCRAMETSALSIAGLAPANTSSGLRPPSPQRVEKGRFHTGFPFSTTKDWTSGDINWLLDVIAPSAKLTSSVLANFGKVVKGGNLRLHPLIARLVDEDTLKKLGAEKMGAEKAGDHQ
jgi:hypothetical protein